MTLGSQPSESIECGADVARRSPPHAPDRTSDRCSSNVSNEKPKELSEMSGVAAVCIGCAASSDDALLIGGSGGA